jgi:hypothetical protein
VGGTCGTHGGGERYLQITLSLDLREIGIDGANWVQLA